MSAVTAVPLRPLAPRSVLRLWIGLALLVIAAAGLAWWGTRGLQVVTLESGTHYRALEAGSGPAFTSQDAVAVHIRLHVNNLEAPAIADTTQDDDGAEPLITTYNNLPPGLRAVAPAFHGGGRYLIWVPARVYMGADVPAAAPFTNSDTLVLEVRVLQVAPGRAMAVETQRVQQMMQRQMQQQQGAAPPGAGPPGRPGAPAPGAAPPPPAGR